MKNMIYSNRSVTKTRIFRSYRQKGIISFAAAVFAFACLNFVASPSEAQFRHSNEQVADFFDKYMARALKEGDVPGAALIVVRDGQVILSKGYGVSDIAAQDPLSPSKHLLRQGSISKILTWIMVMQLVEEGALDLDKDLNTYLPFKVEPRSAQLLTMRHLLTHSGGFTERFKGVFGKPVEPLCTTVALNLPDRVSAPGVRASYSNSGTAIAACAVEKLTGLPFEQAVEERILKPLQMSSSTFAQPPPKSLRSRLVSHYPASSNVPKNFEYIAIAPAGSLHASAEDMGRLLTAIMLGRSAPAGHLLSPKSFSEMLRLQKPLVPHLPDGFGLGFLVREHGGRQYIGHGGTTMAAITDMEIVPDLNLGWYIGMTGLGYGGSAINIRAALPGAVIDHFAPDEGPLKAFGPSSAAELEGNWLPARRYRSGPLKLSDLNLIQVQANPDGSLHIDSVADSIGQPLRWIPQGRDRFVEEASGISLVAVRDSSGGVIRFASSMVNPVSDLERAPAWLGAALPSFAISAGLILAAGLVLGVMAVVRCVRRRGNKDWKSKNHVWRAAAHQSVCFFVATLVGWLVLIALVSDDPYRLTTADVPLRILGLAALAAPLATFPMFARSIILLRARNRVAGSLMGLVGGAALTCSVLFYALGLASLSTQF